MKRLGWLVCGLAALLLACSPVLAQARAGGDKPRRAKREKGRKPKATRGEYAIMASVCKLTDAEKEKLEQLLVAQKAAQAAWKEKNGAKLAELRKASKAAREAKDKDKAKAISAEMKQLTEELKKLAATQKAEITAILTPAQKDLWAAFTLYRTMMRVFARAKLTDDQKDKARAICAAACKDMAKLEGKELRTATNDLKKKITDEVLTDEQREAMKRKRPPKEKKPKGERGKKKKRPAGAAR